MGRGASYLQTHIKPSCPIRAHRPLGQVCRRTHCQYLLGTEFKNKKFNNVDDPVIVPATNKGLYDKNDSEKIIINNRNNDNDYSVISNDLES